MKNKPITIRIDAVPKPRMTQADRWRKRPPVERYWAYKDELKLKLGSWVMPECNYHLIFTLAMPKSWSEKKRDKMRGLPHQQKPDKDNLEKGFLDALLADDSKVWDGRVSKYWWDFGSITLEECEPAPERFIVYITSISSE